MENSQLVKVYTIKEIEEIAKNYKLGCVEDLNGKKICSWNVIKTPLKQHLKECINRLALNIYPDGYYHFCFAQAVRYQKDNHEKFIYCKGNPPKEPPQFNQQKNGIDRNELLSVTSALGYITQIAELKSEITRLEYENKRLTDENAVLEAELEEFEREEGLSENKPNDTLTFLKESSPTFMSAIDRYFELQDKRIALEEKKLEKGIVTPPGNKTVKRTIKTFETGTPEHLNFIRLLHKEQKEEQLTKELDKLEIFSPEQYQEICTELNLFEDEN